MSKTTDVIIVGSGLAGLTAALAAASNNCKVRVISEGMGTLAIAGGSVDVLGYNNLGQRLEDPWTGFEFLPPQHPYALLGEETVKTSLEKLADTLTQQGLRLQTARDENGVQRNFRLPTIVGTLKPTWMFADNIDPDLPQKAKRVLVISFKGFRDCRPRLVISQLRKYKDWTDKEFLPLILPSPFNEEGRSLNALDLAHAADRIQGCDWLLNAMKNKGKAFDLALLPPIMGARADSPIRGMAQESLGCPYLEMLSVPPGVGGLRIRDALVKKLRSMEVEFFENALVKRGTISNGNCNALVVDAAGREVTHHAKAFVIATGGILNGGVLLEPGKAREAIFDLSIPVPENVNQWTEPEIFGSHLVTKLGVETDKRLNPVNSDGKPVMKNVFFAGRTLGGYDYASEKSGFGVAAATGWQAGCNAADLARPHNNQEAGA